MCCTERTGKKTNKHMWKASAGLQCARSSASPDHPRKRGMAVPDIVDEVYLVVFALFMCSNIVFLELLMEGLKKCVYAGQISFVQYCYLRLCQMIKIGDSIFVIVFVPTLSHNCPK